MTDSDETIPKLDPPTVSTTRRVVEAAGEGALNLIPVVGGAMAVIWVQAVGNAYTKRRQEWERRMADAVEDLRARVDDITPDKLVENTEFLDALAFATAAATATGQAEKLDALRNCVLNAALPSDVDADTQAIFMRHVRDFTPSHLRLLKLLANPPAWFEQHGIPWQDTITYGGIGQNVVEVGLPELAGRRNLYDQLYNDITAAGLTTGGGLHTTISGNGLKQQRASETGKAFLAFITDPRDQIG